MTRGDEEWCTHCLNSVDNILLYWEIEENDVTSLSLADQGRFWRQVRESYEERRESNYMFKE